MADGAEGGADFFRVHDFLHAAVAVDVVLFVAAGDGAVAAVVIELFRGLVHVLGEPPLVGPDGFAAASGILSLAGIDDQELVHVAVAVPVVDAPVDVALLQLFRDIDDEVLGVLVVVERAAVLRQGVGQFHEGEVEGEVELTVALCLEIVVQGAREGFLAEVLGVEDLVPLLQRGGVVGLEVLVLEGGHDHQLPAAADVGARVLRQERGAVGEEGGVGCSDAACATAKGVCR